MGEIKCTYNCDQYTYIFIFIFIQYLFIYFKLVKDGTHSFVKLLSQYHKHVFCVVVFIL